MVELWRHYENRIRGVNVWILTDGTVVQDTATAENSNTDLSQVYPWNANDPTAPYVTSTYIDPGQETRGAVVHTVKHSNPPVAFFYGGRTNPITTAQATLLTNYTAFGAGYADCITGP